MAGRRAAVSGCADEGEERRTLAVESETGAGVLALRESPSESTQTAGKRRKTSVL